MNPDEPGCLRGTLVPSEALLGNHKVASGEETQVKTCPDPRTE